MKILIILFLVAASICTKSFGQVKEIMISRCEKSHVTISEIDIITSPLPQDEEGKTVSQIKSGFTTIYICNKPGIIDTNYSLKIDKLFDGEKKPLEAAGKSEKTGLVGFEKKSTAFVVLRSEKYFLLSIYPDSLDRVTLIELLKIVDRNNVNIFTLKVPFVKNVFIYPELVKILNDAGVEIK